MRAMRVLRVFVVVQALAVLVISGSVPLNATAAGCVAPPAGLVSWWPGDGHAGDIVDANHGTPRNGATFAAGQVGVAFSFDGIDDFVHVPDAPNLRLTSLTIEFWFKLESANVPFVNFVTKQNSDRDRNYIVYVHPPTGFFSASTSFSGVQQDISSGVNVVDGQWHHGAFVIDDVAKGESLYVDGVFRASLPFTGSPDPSIGAPLFIGGAFAFGNMVHGQMDEVGIYNRALSASEIRAIFEIGSGGKCKTRNIEVAPDLIDFGSVEVGSSTTARVTISNTGITPLGLSGISLASSGGGFSVASAPPLPTSLFPGATVDVGLVFAPSAIGSFSNALFITSDDPQESLVQVDLVGAGVVTEVPPGQQIAAIISFFHDSVTAGTLEGSGPGSSAAGRLGALRNMLEAADDLIAQGAIADACVQLQDALRRTDGNPRPPDFVSGTAAAELASRIATLLNSLGCS